MGTTCDLNGVSNENWDFVGLIVQPFYQHMAMDQYLWGWTSILAQPFWCEQKGYRLLTHPHYIYIYLYICILNIPTHFAGNLGDATGTLRSLRNQPGVHPKIIDFPAAEKHWEKAIEMGTSGDVEPWFLVLPRKSLAISGRNCTIAYHFCWNQSFCGWSPALLTKSDLVNVIF